MSKQLHDPRDTKIYDNVLYTNWLNDRPPMQPNNQPTNSYLSLQPQFHCCHNLTTTEKKTTRLDFAGQPNRLAVNYATNI